MSRSENTMYLYGRISVLERLKANPKSIKKVLLQDNVSLPEMERLIKANNIILERLPLNQLERLKNSKDLQGVLAKVDKYKYTDYEDLLDTVKNKKTTLIFLDRVNDPQNLGSIMRTAACFGRFAIVIPEFHACGVTEAVLHVASGGENYLPVSQVTNISTAIIQAKEQGCWIAGAEASDNATELSKTSFAFPLGLVLGSEGEGIRPGIQNHLDYKVRIPMQGAALSFNVGIACAVFCFEIARQRQGSYEK